MVTTDAVTGFVDSTVYFYSREKLPRSIRYNPDKYYTKLNRIDQVVKDAADAIVQTTRTDRAYDDIAPYLWLPIEEVVGVDGAPKARASMYYLTDTVRFYGGNDTLNGYAGNDLLDGGTGNDKLDGGIGNDKLFGGDGNDTLVFHEDASEGGANGFGSARNSIAGGAGNDTVLIDVKGIYDLDASVSGGAGNDVISLAATGQSDAASHYASALYGNDGDDLLRFSVSGTGEEISFSSRLDGGAGNDTLAGSALADTLVGGIGADHMSGGGGNDVFVLGRDGGAEADVVTDFTSGADHFDLGAFSLSLAGLQALLAASSGNTLALSTLGGRDVVLAGLDVHDLATSDFIL